jgi:hypothetical protein
MSNYTTTGTDVVQEDLMLWEYFLGVFSDCKLGVVVHVCNPRYSGGRGRRIKNSRLAWGKVTVRLCLKKKKKKTGLEVWLKGALEGEALSSNSVPP